MHRPPDRALKQLLDLTVRSDDAAQVIDAAGATLCHPLGLVDSGGEALGCSPENGEGQRALAVARSAARNRVVSPPGWSIAHLAQDGVSLGILAIGDDGPSDDETRDVLGLLPTMLAGQLRRAALVRTQQATFVHRLISDRALSVHRARREAAELGVPLADAYWIAILDAPAGALRPGVLEQLEHDARALEHEARALTASADGRLVLLHPGPRDGEHPSVVGQWLRRVAERARVLAPASRAQLIAAEGRVELARLQAQVAQLEALGRFGRRADGDTLVAWAGEYALDRLLFDSVAPDAAARFVDQQLGSLLAGRRRDVADLLRVLEASLDFPRHEEAARHCYMHRNTFRHRLRVASDMLGRSLEHPDVRLAVHVALKLRRVADLAR